MKSIAVLMPVYNDWESASSLVNELNRVLIPEYTATYVLVDDGSFQEVPRILTENPLVKIVPLVRNFGHQRAIAIGLSWIAGCNLHPDLVVVMDSDGEDDAAGLTALLKHHETESQKIIFASRINRKEGGLFKVSYFIYKILFRLLTGARISFGNFSLIPGSVLKKLVYSPEIWNHYSSGIMRSKLNYTFIPVQRGKRIAGSSKMSFVSLVLHGLSAISVYVDIVAVRLLLTFLVFSGLSVIGVLIVLYYRFFTGLAIPGWATGAVTGLILIFLQALLISLFLAFIALNYRSQHMIIPAREYRDYILNGNVEENDHV
jgi:hypothetical protein